jgi:hypothetical protein
MVINSLSHSIFYTTFGQLSAYPSRSLMVALLLKPAKLLLQKHYLNEFQIFVLQIQLLLLIRQNLHTIQNLIFALIRETIILRKWIWLISNNFYFKLLEFVETDVITLSLIHSKCWLIAIGLFLCTELTSEIGEVMKIDHIYIKRAMPQLEAFKVLTDKILVQIGKNYLISFWHFIRCDVQTMN